MDETTRRGRASARKTPGERREASGASLLKKVLTVSLILYLVVPVLVARFSGSDSRSVEAAGLDELDHEEVRFRNAEQGRDLADLLFLPEGEGAGPGHIHAVDAWERRLRGRACRHQDGPPSPSTDPEDRDAR